MALRQKKRAGPKEELASKAVSDYLTILRASRPPPTSRAPSAISEAPPVGGSVPPAAAAAPPAPPAVAVAVAVAAAVPANALRHSFGTSR
jgi:hypothetical protein